jgi:hypothetical protein
VLMDRNGAWVASGMRIYSRRCKDTSSRLQHPPATVYAINEKTGSIVPEIARNVKFQSYINISFSTATTSIPADAKPTLISALLSLE